MLRRLWLKSLRSSLLTSRRRRGRVDVQSQRIEKLEDRALLAAQVVGPTAGTLSQDIVPGSAVSIGVQYSTTDDAGDPAQIQANTFGVRLHYDSSVLTFDDATNVFTTGQISAPADQAEGSVAGDDDDDADTDRYIIASWADIVGGNWPGVANAQPLDVFSANFTTMAGFTGSSLLNFTRTAAPLNLVDFTPTSATVNQFVIPNVSIANATDVTEGGDSVFAVTLDQTPSGTVTIEYSTADGTATVADSDYTAAVAQTLTFTPTGPLTQNITVSTTADGNVELDETVIVNLSTPVNAVITTGQGTGTILNDDSPTVSIADSAGVAEGSAAVFAVSIDQTPLAGDVTVTVSTVDGTATAGSDYAAVASQVITFTMGTTVLTQNVSVTATDDALSEDDETFMLTIDSVTGGVATGAASATILANDDPNISIADAGDVAEGTDSVFTVTLDQAPARTLAVDFVVTNGTAEDGTDLTATTDTLTFFVGGALTQNITVPTLNDTLVEVTENFTVDLSNATNGTITTAQATGQITSDDIPTVTIADISVAEGTDAVFAVTLDQAPLADVTVTLSTADGTAIAPGDYTSVAAGVLTFTPSGALSQTVTVTTIDDSDFELSEAFTLVADSVTGANAPVGPATATLTNDDFPTISISDAVSVAEGTGAVFTVTLDQLPLAGADVTIDVVSVDGTALAGTDFEAFTQTLTFTSTGSLTQTVTVNTTDDTTVEGDKAFTLMLSNPGNATITDDTGDGTITSPDVPAISVDSPVSVVEGVDVVFTVTLDQAPLTAVTVDVVSTDGTAIAPGDYTAQVSQTLTFNPGESLTQQITITSIDDSAIEGDEAFTLDLSNPSGATIAVAQGSATLTDNDVPTISIDDVTVAEGTAAVFTVTLDAAPTTALTVDVSTTDGTAIAPGDYTALATQTLTFNPGESLTQQVTVTTIDDADVEGDESLTVTLSNATNVTVGDAEGQATISANDGVTITITDVVSVTEGQAAVFTVTLSEAPAAGANVTVDITTVNGTATDATDYTAVTQSLTFTSTGALTQQITVATAGNTTIDADRGFTVVLSNAANSLITAGVGTATIQNDDLVSVSISDSAAVTEGEDAVFIVSLSEAPISPVTVTLSTATGMAAAPADFTAVTDLVLTFNPGGSLTQNVTVTTIDDATGEASEDFFVNISAATNANIVDDQGRALINDNEFTAQTVADAPPRIGTDLRQTITWEPVTGAVQYEVWTVRVFPAVSRVFQADGIVTTNSFTPPEDLTAGMYRFWVRSYGANGGAGPWSNGVTYEVLPTVVSPVVPTFQVRPTFTWNAIPNAPSYELFIRHAGGNLVIDDLQGTSYTPPQDLPEVQRWWIRSSDAISNRGYSDAADVTRRSHVQTLASGNITWQPVTGAGRYILHVLNTDTNTVVVREDQLTGTSFSPTAPLPAGNYTGWVKAIDGATDLFTDGQWSKPTFAIIASDGSNVPLASLAVQLTAPSGTVTTATPNFTWNTAAGASEYRVQVRNAVGSVVIDTQLASNAFTPVTALANADYRAWVRAIGSDGRIGAWSAAVTFSVIVQTPAVESESSALIVVSALAISAESSQTNPVETPRPKQQAEFVATESWESSKSPAGNVDSQETLEANRSLDDWMADPASVGELMLS